MSSTTPSLAVSLDEMPTPNRRKTRLRNVIVAGGALSVIALVFCLARLHHSRPAPHTLHGQNRPGSPDALPASFPVTSQSLTGPLSTSPFSTSPFSASPLSTSPLPTDSASPSPMFALPSAASPATGGAPLSAMMAQLRQRLQNDPGDLHSRIQLASLLDSQGQGSEAEDVLRVALQRKQNTPELYHALGLVYLHSKVFQPAAQAFYIETRLSPNNFEAHQNLAAVYAYLGKTDKAQHEFETAHKIDPSAPDPYMGLAFLNNGADRYPYAVKYLKEYIRRSKQPGPGYGLLCRVYLNMRLFDQAMEAGRTASADMPDNASVWYNLGQAYAYRPDEKYLSDAVQAFETTVRLDPNWGHAHFELGHAYSRLNRPADAIAHYREAVRCEPTVGKYAYELGQLLVHQGQTAEGQQILTKAAGLIRLNQRESQLLDQLSTQPNVPHLMFDLALVKKQLGQYELAQNWLRSVLQADPNYPQARSELDEVQRMAATTASRP